MKSLSYVDLTAIIYDTIRRYKWGSKKPQYTGSSGHSDLGGLSDLGRAISEICRTLSDLERVFSGNSKVPF